MGADTQEEALVVDLHTAARWYCISAEPSLMPGSGAVDYEEPDGEEDEEPTDGGGGPKVRHEIREWTRGDFWHDELIPELLWEIERATPDAFRSVGDVRSFLTEAARIAADTVWTRWTGPQHWVAWTKECANDAENLRLLALERERFQAHLTGLLSDDLRNVAPLPYRRTLSNDEVDAIWDGLHARWPSHSLWFLGEAELREYEHHYVEEVHTFWWSRFAENVPLDVLRAALREAGVRRVWQVDWDHSYEVDVEHFVPEGQETHFTSAGFDWVIYCDHESQLTVAGDLMTPLLGQVWPDWERYEDEDYTTKDICPRCGSTMRMTHGFELYCPSCST